jgi:hypothetical protein
MNDNTPRVSDPETERFAELQRALAELQKPAAAVDLKLFEELLDKSDEMVRVHTGDIKRLRCAAQLGKAIHDSIGNLGDGSPFAGDPDYRARSLPAANEKAAELKCRSGLLAYEAGRNQELGWYPRAYLDSADVHKWALEEKVYGETTHPVAIRLERALELRDTISKYGEAAFENYDVQAKAAFRTYEILEKIPGATDLERGEWLAKAFYNRRAVVNGYEAFSAKLEKSLDKLLPWETEGKTVSQLLETRRLAKQLLELKKGGRTFSAHAFIAQFLATEALAARPGIGGRFEQEANAMKETLQRMDPMRIPPEIIQKLQRMRPEFSPTQPPAQVAAAPAATPKRQAENLGLLDKARSVFGGIGRMISGHWRDRKIGSPEASTGHT